MNTKERIRTIAISILLTLAVTIAFFRIFIFPMFRANNQDLQIFVESKAKVDTIITQPASEIDDQVREVKTEIPAKSMRAPSMPQLGDSLGTVHASDEDHGTVLTYTIIQGNRDGALCFGDPLMMGPDHTGIIRIARPDIVYKYKTFTLVIKVTDNGIPGKPYPQLSCKARVRIRYPDRFVVEPL